MLQTTFSEDSLNHTNTVTSPSLFSFAQIDCILEEDNRKEKAIETYNAFNNKVPDDRLPHIILNSIKTKFYNTSQYDLSRLKDDPNNIDQNFDEYILGFSQESKTS